MLMISSAQEQVIFDFRDEASVHPWSVINDGVMGGLSTSSMRWKEGGLAVFSGTVSLENNGGFASARANLPGGDLQGFTGIALRVKGDGKTYKARIRTDTNFDGVTFSKDFFAPAGEWTVIRLPFTEFRPTFRGRVLTGIGPLHGGDVRQVGFLVGDKQAGAFVLEVGWMKAF